ncbi:MAG: hypothetical protein EOO28_00825 [Comamonadaceae bacterium]|nr:MAG: hypothetical protein EOO28_00825 [Comamonadaceae bacterium]
MDLQTRTLFTNVSTPPPSLAQWDRVMRHAQVAAGMSQGVLALAGSWEALSIAKQLCANPPPGRADDCVAALVVSHHNLADLQLEAGTPDLAAGQLCHAHETLLALMQDTPSGANLPTELRQAAWRHSRETHAGLLRYLAEHGPHPAISRALQAGCLVVFAGVSPTRH